MTTRMAKTTRRSIVIGAAPVVGAVAAACTVGATPGPSTSFEGPKEISWMGYQSTPERQGWFEESFKLAGKANGVNVVVTWEGSADYWTKRQAEYAGGTTSADVMVLNSDWVIPGGLNGMFVDHAELMRRDKVDPKQYYKAALDMWAWKGKQWAIPCRPAARWCSTTRRCSTSGASSTRTRPGRTTTSWPPASG